MFFIKLLARLRSAVGLVGGFAGERSHEQDLEDELQFHLEKAVERNLRRGSRLSGFRVRASTDAAAGAMPTVSRSLVSIAG